MPLFLCFVLLLLLAFSILLKGHPLVAVHKARFYKRSDGFALGPGPFVTALEYASDTTAIVVGKPRKEFFLSALDGLCDPHEAFMIGDVSIGFFHLVFGFLNVP